jgi:hypothetical protein
MRGFIPDLAGRKFNPAAGLLALEELSKLVGTVDLSLYESSAELPRLRISPCDAND